ncbi:CDP-alcohol phosphatidyltransferase family protein [Candidatus Saccharibacteria bacterium]|nr:CDP-alcohol phosphatidyltransferase family protein [Candidatus Saccharibacteria bacterium]MBR3230510.1 CDP-alcohol phosphatidyltransferase family protein [Candidatus Saccharibacteria bacterium]
MQKYFADILTLARLILSLTLFVLAFTGADSGVAFVLFILGELTDAFDGTCATKWPFPKGKAPKYRKYAAKYDIYADTLLAFAMALFFTVRVNTLAGLIIAVGYMALAIIIDLIVYGKLIGHPDDFRPCSLMDRNFKLAKKIVLARRNLYVALIALVAVWSLWASSWDIVVKITTTTILAIIASFLWGFLAQRRHNISRDAVDIEKKLSK